MEEIDNLNKEFINLFDNLQSWSNEYGYNLISSISSNDFYRFCNNFTISKKICEQEIDDLNLGKDDLYEDNDDY
jgi:hypothetical protein